MKSVLTSIQPYFVFLIIARKMGWNIDKEKKVEVRKGFPNSEEWDKRVAIYCSQNKKSFDRIPKEYQPLMQPLLGKVIGEFACDRIDKYNTSWLDGEDRLLPLSCLNDEEIMDYMNGYLDKMFYAWYISDLKIYDEPKELSEFRKAGFLTEEEWLFRLYPNTHCHYEAWAKRFELIRPPQSWCFVEEIEE